ncbi:hypothetical protein PR048_020302 [Dryococelus australis]|uniref:Uncharacterized protein n=1 Tax=Dryococelus australis TaxID=614101 RepID=A0ABQ9H5X3_9NEOP|nr:hypothetical protein PR048_020302 [Dryococelus australis]
MGHKKQQKTPQLSFLVEGESIPQWLHKLLQMKHSPFFHKSIRMSLCPHCCQWSTVMHEWLNRKFINGIESSEMV